MNKLTFKLLPSSKNAVNGVAPITLRLTYNRKSTYLSLGKLYSIPINDWDNKKDKPKGLSQYSQLNHNLRKITFVVENELLKICNQQNQYSLSDIREIIKIRLQNIDEEVERIVEDVEPTSQIDFLTYFKHQVDRMREVGKYTTYVNYKKIYSTINTYLKGRRIPFEHINVKFLEDYELYLKNTLGNKTNSIHNNFKVVRTILNKAIRENLLTFEKYPFRIFKLKTEYSQREYLTIDELHQIENHTLKIGTAMYHHRNMYLFACYTGLRVSDVILLKWNNIVDNNKLYIRMRKTELPVTIKMINRAIELLELYGKDGKDSDTFIFPPLKNRNVNFDDKFETGKVLSSITAYINKNLHFISADLKLGKRLNFHSSRHTFATLLLNNNTSIYRVKELLGHTQIQTTLIYSHLVSKDLDDEMDRFNTMFN